MSAGWVWVWALPAIIVFALLAWAISTARRNVGLVDIFWPLFLLLAAVTSVWLAGGPSPRAVLVLALVSLWAVRLATHLAVRNWNAEEDRRYRDIRARHEPGFAWKSLYLVFGLQAVLAWLIAAPLAGAIASPTSINLLDMAGAALVLFGFVFETLGDAQLSRFKADPHHKGRVLDTGLWRYTRHPNYFGECCIWWGIGLIALAAGAWWTLFSPVIMTVLLLKVSGVTLLEKDIQERRPAYRDYIAHTNAFVPGPSRAK